MKKHSIKLMLIMLVIILCLSTVLLAACNDDDDKKTPVDNTVATGKMLSDVINNVSSSMSFGESFGADISAEFVIDDKTATNKDVSFKLTAKGNANGKQNAREDETNFVIELTKEEGASREILLGIAYEWIEEKPYFFVNIMGSSYKKINGYSLAALYKMTQDSANTSADDGEFGLDTIITALVPMLFGEKGTVVDNVYTFEFDLAKTVSAILENKEMILTVIGMEEADVNALVAQYLGGLNYEQNGETVNVHDLATLEAFFKRGMSLKGTLVFAFDNNNKFLNASASFDYGYHKEDKANYTLRINKAEIGMASTPVNSFENFKLTADERKTAQAFNALNFSLNGNATAFNDKGEVAHNYTIEVQSDIDAFELLNLLENGTSKENIIATLEKLGYFHLEVNEVYEDDAKEPLNIITLHSKFEEGFAVVSLDTNPAALGKDIKIGGVYDFDALIDVIGMLTAGSDEPAEPTEPAEPEQGIMEQLEGIINTVKEVLGYFNIDNMQEDGVTVALKDLVYMICNMLNVDTSNSTLSMAINGVLGCESMNFKFETPTFGSCVPVETSTIKCGIRTSDYFKNGNEDFIKEIKSLDGLATSILQNDENISRYMSELEAKKAFEITGVNLKGEAVKTSGYIMAMEGLDVSKAGTQNVTFYIAIANDFLGLSSLLNMVGIVIDDLIPLSGVLKFQTEIEVVAFDANAQVTVTNLKTEDQTVVAGAKKAFDIIRTKTYGEDTEMTIGSIGTYVVDASLVRAFNMNGEDVTESVINEDGYIVKAGAYNLKLVLAGYSANCCKVIVKDAYAVRADGNQEIESLALGGTWTFDEYKVFVLDESNQSTEVDIAPQYKIGYKTLKSLEEAFDKDGNNYTLKKDLAYVGQNFTISFNNVQVAPGLKKTVNVNIPIVSDYVLDEKLSLFYFGKSLNEEFVLSIHDVQYKVVYKNGAWVAVNENGDEKAVQLSLKWKSTEGEAVTVNEAGFISNYPNENKDGARSTKVYYTLTIDGYTYSSNFTAYELAASNKTLNLSETQILDGAISNVNRIEYVGADGEVAELEFKYGAEGYAIYVKGTDTKVYDVTVTVTKDGAAYQLTDGKFTEVGKYKVEYSLTINGVEQTFYHDVTVK